MKACLRNRLLAVPILLAVVGLFNSAAAQGTIDASNAGQAKAKREAIDYRDNNKPTDALVVAESFFQSKYVYQYTFDIPKGRLNPVAQKNVKFSLSGSGTIYPFNVANALRLAMLEASDAPAPKDVFDVWHNEKMPQFINYLQQPPFPASVPIAVNLFLKDWDEEVMKFVNLEADEPKKAAKFKLALKQAAYQFTDIAIATFAGQTAFTAPLSSTGSSSNGNGANGQGTGAGSGSHHADVIHARLMNGIYRRHGRNMNKVERISSRY